MSEAVAEETTELTVGNPSTFLGEIEEMDLSELKDKTFFVGTRTGKRESGLYMSTTIRGPYTFIQMVRETSNMWRDYQLHAHVIIMSDEREARNEHQDECTIDFIEAKSIDIIMASWLDGSKEEKYTCKAGILENQHEEIEKIEENCE